jgi:hypothetical protein
MLHEVFATVRFAHFNYPLMMFIVEVMAGIATLSFVSWAFRDDPTFNNRDEENMDV